MLVTPFSPLLLGLLPSKAPCQQRGSCPDPGQWDGEVETGGRGQGGIWPPPQREKMGAPEDLTRLQLAHAALPWLLTFHHGDGCLQEPSQSLPSSSAPPTAPAPPLGLQEDTSDRDRHTAVTGSSS